MAGNVFPLIGLTTYNRPVEMGGRSVDMNGLLFSYINAIRAAGGLPVLIPHGAAEDELMALVGRLDGLILPGGEDVDPTAYGEILMPECGRIDLGRDALELQLARYAVERGLPLLAICRGHQVLNVVLGGTLWQDLPSQVPDSQQHTCRDIEEQKLLAHTVRVSPDSHLRAILGVETIGTNSSHHQAIRELAAGLIVTAWAPDEVIEAIELPEHPFAIGLQWHPERMVQAYPRMLRPFEALVDAAHA
jgi:putative glutamine amidotransferase